MFTANLGTTRLLSLNLRAFLPHKGAAAGAGADAGGAGELPAGSRGRGGAADAAGGPRAEPVRADAASRAVLYTESL
jgi:hypothetical protein